VRSAARFSAPVLLLHGQDDANVPIGQSRHLKKQLESFGKDVGLIEFEGDDHYLNTTAVRRTLLSESDAFLSKHIKAR
jgi:dipeptidyl aminopeptidase/acylaminoacyl peptidase